MGLHSGAPFVSLRHLAKVKNRREVIDIREDKMVSFSAFGDSAHVDLFRVGIFLKPRRGGIDLGCKFS